MALHYTGAGPIDPMTRLALQRNKSLFIVEAGDVHQPRVRSKSPASEFRIDQSVKIHKGPVRP